MASKSRPRAPKRPPLPPLAAAAQVALRADAALAAGETLKALTLYREAATITEDAVRADNATELAEPTRALMISNAAMLWYKGNAWDRAEKLAGEMLGRGPQAAHGTLRQVLMACWQARSTAQHDHYFTPLELLLDGGAIAYGLAPIEEVTSRTVTMQSLLWRTSELEANLPYRRRGLPVPEVRRAAQVYSAADMPGSYRIQLRVKSPSAQGVLFPHHVRPEAFVAGGEPLVHRAIELASAIAEGGSGAARRIRDPLYRIGLSRLVRDLAPDGKRVTDVRMSGGTSRVSADFSGNVRTRIVDGIRAAYEEAGFVELRGELAGMELRENDLQIFVRQENEERRTFTAPRNVGYEEKVGPLWGRTVAVVARADGKRSILQEIEPTDEPIALDAPDADSVVETVPLPTADGEIDFVVVRGKRRDE